MDTSLLQQLNINAAGIDIGSECHYVAVPPGRDPEGQDVRHFSTFTADLHTIADWLHVCGIDTVAMESTGIYWIALFEVLESRGFDVRLVNPRAIKNAPGRKTDVLDCQWIQQLHTYGLLQSAFRPQQQICELRAYMRQRAMLIAYASHHVQHMQKALEQMNIKLDRVLNDITGLTGMNIIRAIIGGERNPLRLAAMRNARCTHTEADIAKALEGTWRSEHIFALKQAVELYDFYQKHIIECESRIERHLENFDDRSTASTLEHPSGKSDGSTCKPLHFDARGSLRRMTGVDLTRIDGIAAPTALTIIGEIGIDMSPWPTVKHFTSWLGLCPGSKVSGGKRLSSKTKPSANRAAHAFRLAAYSLQRSKSAIGAFLRRKKSHLGAPKAITATAHKIARIFYTMLKYGTVYVDRGQDYYEQRYQQRVIANLKRKAKQFGFELINIKEHEQLIQPATS
nr:IS110 family transposase [Deltaproteobacteria bacterium]